MLINTMTDDKVKAITTIHLWLDGLYRQQVKVIRLGTIELEITSELLLSLNMYINDVMYSDQVKDKLNELRYLYVNRKYIIDYQYY